MPGLYFLPTQGEGTDSTTEVVGAETGEGAATSSTREVTEEKQRLDARREVCITRNAILEGGGVREGRKKRDVEELIPGGDD
jgi:hypothetical protein